MPATGKNATSRHRSAKPAELLRHAEEMLRLLSSPASRNGAPAGPPRLPRDLQVYRMALNLQNEELERLRAEVRTLRESEASHRVLFESSPDAIFRSSPEGMIFAANPAACAMVGRTEAEIQRIGRDGIIDRNDPRWLELVEQRQRAGTARAETELIRADGSAIPVEVAAALFTDGGGKVCSNLFVRDITGRKRMEQALRASETRYRDLVENANDMIYVCDPGGHWLHINSQAVFRILGYREEDLIGHHFLEIIRPDWQADVGRFYREQFDNRLASSYLEFPVLAKNGREHWIGQSVKLVAEGDRILRFEAIAHDLTEHKAAEEALRKSVAQTQQLVAHLSTVREEESAKIAREVHDELGATLTALRLGLASAIGQVEAGAALRERLASLMNVTDGAVDAVKRISASLRPRLLDTLGLNAAIRRHVDDFARLTGVACDVKVAAQVALPQDRATGVFRIVQESLTNIARHARASHVAVSIRQHSGGLTVTIRDDGVGFDPPTTLRANSYGIAGMRERAQQIGATLDIESKPGAGTTVRLRLRLNR